MSANVCRECTHTETYQHQNEARNTEVYNQTFLVPTKLIERRAVYLSRDTQERADFVVRRLGNRDANLLSFVERIVRVHLEDYAEEIEEWRKL